jgi:hypothetical protein
LETRELRSADHGVRRLKLCSDRVSSRAGFYSQIIRDTLPVCAAGRSRQACSPHDDITGSMTRDSCNPRSRQA